jgi:hypothetical protein
MFVEACGRHGCSIGPSFATLRAKALVSSLPIPAAEDSLPGQIPMEDYTATGFEVNAQ